VILNRCSTIRDTTAKPFAGISSSAVATVIPSLVSRKTQHAVDKAVYALRNRIERFFNRVKNSRPVATRYDKLIESFAAFVGSDNR
jgi:transposase